MKVAPKKRPKSKMGTSSSPVNDKKKKANIINTTTTATTTAATAATAQENGNNGNGNGASVNQKSKARTMKHNQQQHGNQKSQQQQQQPLHMYNIALERELLDGTCSGCLGERDKKARATDEPVLLCDGRGCKREYHLKCIPYHDPPMEEVPDGAFYCIDCDPLSTSKLLQDYFHDVDADRGYNYQGNSRRWVEDNIQKGMKSAPAYNKEGVAIDIVPVSELQRVEELHIRAMDDTMFLQEHSHSKGVVIGNSSNSVGGGANATATSAVSAIGASGTSGTTQSQEKDGTKTNADTNPGMAASASATKPSNNNRNNTKKKKKTSTNNSNHAAATSSSLSTSTSSSNNYSINADDPELLVGNIMKMYCPYTDSYHTGRIIDWRSAIPPGEDPHSDAIKNKYYGTGAIATTEYLTRYPKGLEGRKKTVYHWIVLEEHSCAISLSIVMALKDKGRGLNGWKPAHIMYRTALELIPVRNLLMHREEERDEWGFACFFGSTANLYLHMASETVDYYSDAFKLLREKKTIVSLSSTTKRPKNYESQIALMGMAIAAARAEVEERKRVFRWHTLPLQNRYHDKALTVIDENSFDLLLEQEEEIVDTDTDTDTGAGKGGGGNGTMEVEGDRNNKGEGEEKKELDGSSEKNDDGSTGTGTGTGGASTANTTTTTSTAEHSNQGLLGLCPQIQQGLDKSWIASRLSNLSDEYSMDSMASLKVRVAVRPTCVALAQYNEKYSASRKKMKLI